MSLGMVIIHRRSPLIVLGVAAALLLDPAATRSQQQSAPEAARSQAKLLAQLESPDWTTRASAVDALVSGPASKLTVPVRDQVLDLYADELEKSRKAAEGQLPAGELKVRAGEQYAEYIGYLGTLALRIGSGRALKLLILSPSSPMANSNREIAAYGARVLPMVLARVRDLQRFTINTATYHGPDVESQMGVADILGQMLALDAQHRLKPPLSAGDYASIRRDLRPFLSSKNLDVRFWSASALALARDQQDAELIRQTYARKLRDPRPGNRLLALEHLSRITDPVFAPTEALRKVARADPYNGSLPGGEKDGPYPLRKKANGILNMLGGSR